MTPMLGRDYPWEWYRQFSGDSQSKWRDRCVVCGVWSCGSTSTQQKHEKRNERMKTERTNDQGHKVIQRHKKLVLGIIRS